VTSRASDHAPFGRATLQDGADHHHQRGVTEQQDAFDGGVDEHQRLEVDQGAHVVADDAGERGGGQRAQARAHRRCGGHGQRRRLLIGADPWFAGSGAQAEPQEQGHGEQCPHRDQQFEAHAALVQRLAENALGGEQEGGACDEQHSKALVAGGWSLHKCMIPDAATPAQSPAHSL
jgi:hypothetical protein